MKTNTNPAPENVIELNPAKRPRRQPAIKKRFNVFPFTNESGTSAFRVTGYKRNGQRVRENFADRISAELRERELNEEHLFSRVEVAVRATKLSVEQVQLAELAFLKLGDDWGRILSAVDHWQTSGSRSGSVESPKIDDAVTQYLVWLDASPFREATKRHWKYRMGVFKNSVPNMRVADFTPESIEDFLAKQNVSPVGKDTYRRAASRFFSWCIERPRRWTTTNPCRDVKVPQAEGDSAPEILTVQECERLLRSAMEYKDGLLVPYTAVCLFAGLRPGEAARLNWEQINLADAELRLESNQTKTGRKSKRGRVVTLHKTLIAWLKSCEGKPFCPANWRKDFDAMKLAAGFGTPDKADPDRKHLKPWPSDGMRHSAISYFFRDTGSYGLAAELFGNSESIIKRNYQARVSSDEAKKFYALTPAAVAKS